MKKLVLAAVVAALSGQAMAVNVYNADDATLDVYGEIRTRIKKVEGEAGKFDGDSTKIGVKGKYGIGNDMYVVGEMRMGGDFNNTKDSDNGGEFNFDRGYVGIGHNAYGVVRAGRMPSVHDTLFSHDESYVWGGSAKNGSNAFGTDVANSAGQYEWSNESFKVMAQVQGHTSDDATFKKSDKDETLIGSTNIKNGYALGGVWMSDLGLDITTAYTSVELDDKNSTLNVFDGGEANSFGVQAKYSINSLTLTAAVYNFEQTAKKKTDFDREINSYGLSARYAFANGIGLYGVYDNKETTDNQPKVNNKKLEETSKTFTMGVDFWPHKQFVTYAEFAQEKTENNKVDSKDKEIGKYAVGARFYF